MKHTFLAIAALALLGACGGPDTPDATGFITPGAAVPEGASQEAGDVPRDDYGRPFTYAFLGKRLPAFSGTMLDGSAFSTADLEGQWTVIDVWGLWCGDCVADAPYVAEFATQAAQDPELAFLSIHTPPNAKRVSEAFGKYDSAQDYFNEKGYSYPTLMDTDASIRDALEIAWTPSYLLVAPDLTVQGFRSELSAADGDAVAAFLDDIARVRAAYKAS
ncbi:TlpA family protein disulfide reductase [Henriciella litoralis]|uniref:TlpA family protein disulfide reductase n=1 Tax=Henriciella litoralis TaxID=568102 RepID=UPI0009FE8BFE|nr:TlpA disulfide reductase family protein [Henriciella litoralis]